MAGKYQAYPEYKDSGVEWLGEIPEHWTVLPAKRLFKLVAEPAPNNNDLELLSVYTEIGVRPRKDLEQKGNKASTKDGYWIVKKGDLIVNKLLAWMGAVGYSDYNGVTSPAYDILRSKRDFNPRFYHYLFRSEIAQKEFKRWSRGIMEMRLRLYFEELGRISIPFPPEEEIEKITDFLDYETAQIDTLIDKQQQLIQLLKEKRQAVISHAVTKGLNPDAPMKDSGIEWLGEVPEHWDVASLKYLVSAPIIDGPHLTPEKREDGIPFISAEAISQGYINFEKKWGYISEEDHRVFSQRYCPRKGDILIVKLGATTGVAALVETDLPFNVWVPLATVRAKSNMLSKYIFYLLHSAHVKDAIRLSWTFGTQQTLGLGTLANLSFPVPAEKEMIDIVKFTESKIPVFDRLASKAEESLLLLQERRSALISAAVTGKIDVRGWQPPAKSQPC